MRSFALLFCLLAVASATTTTTTVVVVTTTTTVAATNAAAAGSTAAFDFARDAGNAACTKDAVKAAINSTTCSGFVDLALGADPTAFCGATDNCAAKVGAAVVQAKCSPKFANQASLVCAKPGTTYLFVGAPARLTSVRSTVLAATATPSVACDDQTDFVRQWLLADPAVTADDAIFEAVCQQSQGASCWSNFFGYLKGTTTLASLATSVTATSTCSTNGGCAIAAAGLFAKYFNVAAGTTAFSVAAAIGEYSRGACVTSKALTSPGYCGGASSIDVNLRAVASTFSATSNSFYAGTYLPAAATTTVAPSTATTTKAATTTTPAAAAAQTSTTTAPSTTTTTSGARRRALAEGSTTTTTTVAPFPWVATLTSVGNDKATVCAAIAGFNTVGCCGALVGRVSALLAAASSTTLVSGANNVFKAYAVAESLCPGVVLDPTCQEGTAPTGDAAVSSVTITFTVAGITCTGIPNAVVAPMGEGMAQSLVAAKIAPSMDGTDVSICGKSYKEAKAALVSFGRRLQTASAALTVKGTAAQLTAVTNTKDSTKSTAALATLNSALVAAVQAGAAKALADPAAAAVFSNYVTVASLGVTPVTADAISAPVAVAPKTATTTYTGSTGTSTTGTVSGAPAAMSAIFAPVCAVAAIFAASA